MGRMRLGSGSRVALIVVTAICMAGLWTGQASASVFTDSSSSSSQTSSWSYDTTSSSGSTSDGSSQASGTSSMITTDPDGTPRTMSDSYYWTSGEPIVYGNTSGTMADAQQNPCLRTANHEYEVCTAYKFNSVTAVLAPYYRYVHSSNAATARYVTYRLGSRYEGAAYALIRARVASWPQGSLHVSHDVDIRAVDSNLSTNSATLRTVETWRVTTDNGRVVYSEQNRPHTVTMARVPSYILHKWVVTSIN